MTYIELLVDFHKDAERQGPGSSRETIRALELMDISNKENVAIADIGCGSGSQTITLAQNINGEITAVDLFPDFLVELNKRSEKLGLQKKIKTLAESMENLPFRKGKFDVIWSEGAIYSMGFEAGIKKWKEYIKAGGYLAVSEITWLTNSRPKELEAFWHKEYPEIDTASGKISVLEKNGYTLVGYFVLSQDSWMKNYYQPMEKRFSDFTDKHGDSEMARKIVEEHRNEMELYEKFKDYYSYGFYVARNQT